MSPSSGLHGLIATPLTTLLGIEHPLLLAPMGDAAGGRLAAAVSVAGGLGVIGGGYADPTWLAAELEHAIGSKIGVGFITFALDRHPASLRLALDAEPVAIQLSFGDPRPHADEIHASGALLICQVQSAEEVDAAVAAGADVIVGQGQDAGGHGRAGRATMGLIPSLVDRVSPTPVVAAGGIADGRGLAAALMLGASGATLGTRFLASHEALTNLAEAAHLLSAHAEDTVRTSAFDVVRGPAWPDGYDGRALRNELVDRWERDHPHTDADLSDLRSWLWSAAPDDYRVRPLWAGEGVDLITSIEPAARIVAEVVADAACCLAAVRHLLRVDGLG